MPTSAHTLIYRRRGFIGALACVIAVSALLVLGTKPAAAVSAPAITFVPTFTSGNLGEEATASAAFTISGEENGPGLPSPLKELTVHLPAGVGAITSAFSTCEPQEVGIKACPASALAGPEGPIVMQTNVGAQEVPFKGNIQAVHSTAHGLVFYALLAEPAVVEFTAPASFSGGALTVSFPELVTFPMTPPLSTRSLTLGYNVVAPEACPAGGFAWSADLKFYNNATEHLTATSGCSLPGPVAKRHQEEAAAAAKKKAEEEAAAAAAKKKAEEEAAVAKKKAEEQKSKPPTRAQKLAKALKQCKKLPKKKRAACVAKAKKQYGKAKPKKHKGKKK